MPFSQPAAIFRANVFDKLSGFDERYRSAADFDFAGQHCWDSVSVALKLKPVVAFRVHMGLGAQHFDWNREEKDLMQQRSAHAGRFR